MQDVERTLRYKVNMDVEATDCNKCTTQARDADIRGRY